MTNNSGVYKIKNTSTADFYIGSAVNISKRWSAHRRALVGNRHRNAHLQNAWNKYGEDSFSFETILLCDKSMTVYCEQELLEQLKPAYNIAICAAAPMKGCKTSDETRARQSAALKGKPKTDEHRQRLSKAQTGKHHSEETIAKLSGENNHMFGKHPSEETRAKTSASMTGHKHTAESKLLMSEAAKRRGQNRRCAVATNGNDGGIDGKE